MKTNKMIKSELIVKASEELEKQVADELAQEDPSEEKAKASIKENDTTPRTT